MAYTKLFSTILDSTIWTEPWHIKGVWITMLAMADKDGIVQASVPGLARRATVSTEECVEALARFEQPDEWSRTPDHDGRRIETVQGGWKLLNYSNYRAKMSAEDRRAYKAAKQREYRERDKSTLSTNGQCRHNAEAEEERESARTRASRPEPEAQEPLGEIPTQLETLKSHLALVRRGWGVDFGHDEREALVRQGYLEAILALDHDDWADLGEMLGSSEKMAQRREALKIGMPNRRTLITHAADWLSNLDRWQARHRKRNGGTKAKAPPEPEPTSEEREEMLKQIKGSLKQNGKDHA